MVQLTLDTSAEQCNVVLSRASSQKIKFLTHNSCCAGKAHAEILMHQIDKTLRTASLKPTDLKHIAVTTGPGSFTGLRVGLATARALAIALKIDAVGVGVLEAHIAKYRKKLPAQIIGVILNARRNEFYMQVENSNKTVLQQPALMSVEEIISQLNTLSQSTILAPSTVLVGPNVPRLPVLQKTVYKNLSSVVPDIKVVASLAAERTAKNHPPQPLYLRKPDAKRQKRGLFNQESL